MAKQSSYTDFFKQNDMSKFFEGYKAVPFDMQSMMETVRKNVQALSEAQQIAVERAQAISQRQSQLLSQLVEEQSKIAKEMMTEGTPEEKIAKNADIFKTLYEKTVKNMDELTGMIAETNQEASRIINKRVSASMTELKSSLEKPSSASKKAA